MKLRPYQMDAIDAVYSAWREHRSVLLVMATGTGKTVTAGEILRDRAREGRILWLAHRGELLEQAQQTIQERIGLRCDIEKADSYAQDAGGLVEPAPVVVASVQSMHRGRRTRFGRDGFDTIVVDEAHHAPAKSYRGILGWFSGAKVLGLTATPDRGDGVAMGTIFDELAFEYGIRDGIQEGYLCPITQKAIECADLDLSDVKTIAGDLHQGQLEQALTVDRVLHQIASPLTKEAGERQTLVFVAGVKQAHALVDVLAGYLDDPGQAAAIDGGTPAQVRADKIAAFRRGDLRFLVNCAVLTEGFDAPETDCIAVARPTKSRALYAQMIGRGSRIAPGKQDCLVLDFVGNAGRHSLVTPLDVLAGKALPDETRKRAKELTDQGKPSDEALAQAEQEAIERAQREEERRRREAKVRAEVAYRAKSVDPFQVLDVQANPRGPRATEKQLSYLKKLGLGLDKNPSRAEASALIERVKERRTKGLCTFKQARLLQKYGLPTDLGFEQAKSAIDRIDQNGWRPPRELLDQHQPEAAE